MTDTENIDVLIIGAGISGLVAAKVFKAAGKKIKIIEASDGVGGRVRTDEFDGFLLDRGFQVLLTAYPEAKRFLDYKALDLRSFKPGAIVLNEKGITEIGDPLRDPESLFRTLASPVGSFTDKLKMLSLKLKLGGANIEQIFTRKETTTIAYLINEGFSDKILNQFFKPFLSGIFLEEQLHTSSRMFEFVFKMFSEGDTAIPAKGMGKITEQLAEGLKDDELTLNKTVAEISGGQVTTADGDVYAAKKVLIATAADHVPLPFKKTGVLKNSVTEIYFAADKAPFKKPLIALNASANKMVNNVAVLNNISPEYCSDSRSLVSVSLIGDFENENTNLLVAKAIQELKQWYPECVNWKYLKTYHIPYALPNASTVENDIAFSALKLSEEHFICGDHVLNGSINAAMKSGRIAAEGILSLIN
jgi:protoporphyrinogen oxidase